MLRIKETIIVEGTYDKIKLNEIVDANIIATNGFAIFKNKEFLSMLRAIAEKNGIVVLTDSDKAGFLIRNYIKTAVNEQHVKHAYIPNIEGKEKRKEKPSKEGFLGVEGVNKDVILSALVKAGCMQEDGERKKDKAITKLDFFTDGLSGNPHSSELRIKLCALLDLPTRLSSNSLLDVLNVICTYDEYKNMIDSLKNSEAD